MSKFLWFTRKYWPVLTTLILFLAILPLVLAIHFKQNDDWIYYSMVSNFLKGNFALHPYVAATFYTQGILGFIFSALFGINNLPILTLTVSVLNYLILVFILKDHLHSSALKSLLIGLLLFFNPIHFYSILGFMTENYFLLFLLLGSYFAMAFVKSNKNKDFALANIFYLFGYFVRQLSILGVLSFSISLFLKKDKKAFLKELLLLLVILVFHFLLFPKTPAMYDGNLQFGNIADYKYAITLLVASLVYLGAFTIPLTFTNFINRFNRRTSLYIGLVVATFVIVFALFTPSKLSWGEFPYFQNTFERKGFYPRNIEGERYGFIGIYDVFFYWEPLSKLAASVLIILLAKRVLQKKLDYVTIFIFSYLTVLVITPVIYDRYLLPIIAFILMFLASLDKDNFSRIQIALTTVFILLLVFLNYQFSMDMVKVNNYIWNKSQELVASNVSADSIDAGYSWKKYYGTDPAKIKYIFSYSGPSKMKSYNLVEETSLKFPLSIFVNSKIYLYEKSF